MTVETTGTRDVKIPLTPPKKADTGNASLSEKDAAFREFVLHENMWRVVFYVCTPLALYQSLNQLFKIFDSMMAAHISTSSVSAVAYLSQINLMLSALAAAWPWAPASRSARRTAPGITCW